MVSAAIKINGTLGSRSDLIIGNLVTLTNNDDTGAITWLWEFISKPYTSSATITNPTLATATFTPDVVGSYFVKLTVNTSYISKRVAAVRTRNYKLRIPATEETNEFNEDGNTSGWSKAYYDALLGIDGYIFNITDGYALKTTLDAYATTVTLDGYALKTTLDAYATKITLDAYAQKTLLDAYAQKTLLDAYAQKTLLDAYAQKTLLDAYAQKTLLDAYATKITLDAYATKITLDAYALTTDLYQVKVSGNDTTDGYLEDKISSGTNVFISILNEGGNEILEISVPSGLDDGYLPLPERLTDPPYEDDYGAIYTKDDGYGTTELYYIDNYGDVGKVITEDTTIHEVFVGSLRFTIDPIDHSSSEGLVLWDSYNKCLSAYTEIPDVVLKIGQEQYIRCYNRTGVPITNGQVVYISGSYEGWPTVDLAISSVLEFSRRVIGVATHNIPDDSIGYITTFGTITDFDTSSLVPGSLLYLSPDSYGAITSTIPVAPNIITKIGTSLVQDALIGTFFVNIDRNPSTNTLNDVEGYGQNDGELLIFNSVNSRYEPMNLIAGGNVSITNGPGTITIRDLVDGYLNLPERDANAPHEDGYGKLFTKHDDEYGTTELFYIDNYGQLIQLTQDGVIPASSSGAGFDNNAIHLNRTDEIRSLTETVNPISTDLLVIEDSSLSYAKKKVQIGNLPHDAFVNLTDTPASFVGNVGKYARVNSLENALVFNQVNFDAYAEKTLLDAYAQKVLLDAYAQKVLLDSYATIIDGYIPLIEKITDPTPVANKGAVYVKDDGYLTTKLYYMDNYGEVGKVITEDINNNVNVGNLQFNTELDVPAHNKGMMFWDEYNDTVSIYNSENEITLQIGQEQFIRGYNHSGSQINNGQAVYVHDDYGYFPQISLARSDKTYMTDRCVGIATHDIPNDSVGFITTFGIVKGVDTSSWVPGSILYLSPDSYGSLTNVLPSTPNVVLKIAVVLEQDASVGRVFITITRGQSTGTLDDVSAFGANDGDILIFNSLTETYDPNTFQAGTNIKIINSPGSVLIKSQLDSYLSMPENITDPPYQDGYGGLYTAYDDGYGTTELHYIDNYGQVTQITTNGGLTAYEHDTKSPLGTWLTTSTVSFAARPNQRSIVRKTLDDNRRRIMEDGTWDIANGVADWGYDHVSSQGNSKQLYFYLVPKLGAETTNLVIRASDNIPSVGPIGYTYFKLVWTDYIDAGGLLRPIYQVGNIFQPAYRLYPVTTDPATLGATPVTVKVEYAINDAVPLTAGTAEINGFMTMVGAAVANTGVLSIYVEGQTNLFIQRYTQAKYGNTNTVSCHIPLPGTASKKIGFQTTITGGAIETTNGRGQGLSITSWVDSYIES